MSKQINPRQLKFAEAVVIGTPLDTAYLQAGYVGKHASVRASNLMQNPLVKAHIKELQTKSTDAIIASLIKCKSVLTKKIEANVNDKVTHQTQIKAIETLAKLENWESPQKIDLSVEKKIEDLSYDELHSLLAIELKKAE